MIACITMVKFNGMIIAIKCAKGRGVIMPGGKWEPGETFIECAKRELLEETGLVGKNFRLVFHGESEEGYYTYAFKADITDLTLLSSKEGEVTLANWSYLKASKFGGFYELLQLACGE